MNFAAVDCRACRKALRDPLRETHHGWTRRSLCLARRLAHSCRRHRFLSRRRAASRFATMCSTSTAWPSCAASSETDDALDHRRAHDLDRYRPPYLPPAFDALKQAAREVGSVQIQNVGTVAGNLCNASPAADGVPPLLMLDAEVELRSARGSAHLPLGDFILGNRRTALAAGRNGHRHPRAESRCCRHVRLPQARRAALSGHLHRHGGGAARRRSDGMVAAAAVAVGSCSAVAQRLPALEAALGGPAARTRHWPMRSQAAASRRAVADRRCARQRRTTAARRRARSSPGPCLRRAPAARRRGRWPHGCSARRTAA